MIRGILKRLRKRPTHPIRPKVTPDPARARALELRRRELSYTPEHGFLLDDVTTGRSGK